MSRSWVSPGVAYLTRGLLSVIFPTASSVIIIGRLACLQGFPVSPWLLSVVVLGAAPLWLAAYIFVGVISQRRKATRLGARLVPCIQGRWPGNLDKLLNTIQRFKVEYLGQPVLDEMKELGPTLNYRCLWEDYIVTTEPQHVKTILVTDFHNYVKGAKFREAADSVFGTGVFNSDGETWKRASMFHRTMTRPFFTHDRISHFEIFDRHANRAIALAKDRSRMDLAIDFQDLISRFTLDSASEFLFGHCTDSLSVELPFPDNTLQSTNTKGRGDTAAAFSDAVSQAEHAISRRVIIGTAWKMTEIFADSTAQHMKVIDEFLDPILKAALARHSTAAKLDVNNIAEDQTFLDHLIKLTSDFKVIKDETLNILLAGRDTTASTLTSAIYLLAMHPEILSRLREEIISKVGPIRMPTYGDIKEMKYIQAVLNETMRLFPALPFDVREAVHDTTWTSPEPGKKPLFVPGGVMVIYSVFLMHRRTDLWGPDALEFDPDRWLDERMQKYQLANPFIFVPFNAGPRICLGKKFAYNQMSFMLIRLLQKFSAIALSPEPAMCPPAWWAEKDGRQAIERFKPKFHVMLYAEGGMWVKMEAVDDVEVIQ